MFESASVVGRRNVSVGRAIMASVTTLSDMKMARGNKTLWIEDGW